MKAPGKYWKSIFGIKLFKLEYYAKYLLYKLCGVTLPKLKDQRDYWKSRGMVYMNEILSSGYLDREIFFQNLIMNELKTMRFKSVFEAGAGFGWNIKRAKGDFPDALVAGLDFSFSQLKNAKEYMGNLPIPVFNGDNCRMPFKDKSFEVGFSLGVFMNIHPSKIRDALREMMRVCRSYIIHVEWDAENSTEALRKKRAFKTNIVSHRYRQLYEELGGTVEKFLTYKEFGDEYHAFQKQIHTSLERWEGFEGPEKYVVVVVRV